jgi:hypothetical protein
MHSISKDVNSSYSQIREVTSVPAADTTLSVFAQKTGRSC